MLKKPNCPVIAIEEHYWDRELSARLEGEMSSLRTLFLSGYADAKGIETAIREGKAFLGKPFTMVQLAAAVRSALGRR